MRNAKHLFSLVPNPAANVGLLITNTVIIVSTFLLQNFLPPEIPLYYGQPEGQEQLAVSSMLFVPSFIALLTTIVNMAIASFVKEDFSRKLLIATSSGVTLLAIVTTIRIATLVGVF